MPSIRIDTIKKTASGKAWSIQAGGKWYVSTAPGIEQVQVGQVLNDVIFGSFAGSGGATVYTIDSFSANGPAPPQPQQPQQAQPAGDVLFPDRFYMPFVSNVVAHAIQSGLIKEPKQVVEWAMAAKHAAVLLDKPSEAVKGLIDMKDDVEQFRNQLDENGVRIPF